MRKLEGQMMPAGIVGLEGKSKGSDLAVQYSRDVCQWTEILFIQLTVDEQRERDSESRLRARHGEFCVIKSKFTQARNEEIQEVKKTFDGRHMRMERIDSDSFDYVQFMDDSHMMSVEGKRLIRTRSHLNFDS